MSLLPEQLCPISADRQGPSPTPKPPMSCVHSTVWRSNAAAANAAALYVQQQKLVHGAGRVQKIQLTSQAQKYWFSCKLVIGLLTCLTQRRIATLSRNTRTWLPKTTKSHLMRLFPQLQGSARQLSGAFAGQKQQTWDALLHPVAWGQQRMDSQNQVGQSPTHPGILLPFHSPLGHPHWSETWAFCTRCAASALRCKFTPLPPAHPAAPCSPAATGSPLQKGPRVRSPQAPLIAPARLCGSRARMPGSASYAGAAEAPGPGTRQLLLLRCWVLGAGCSAGRRAGAFRESAPCGVWSLLFPCCMLWQLEFPWKCSETVNKSRARLYLRDAFSYLFIFFSFFPVWFQDVLQGWNSLHVVGHREVWTEPGTHRGLPQALSGSPHFGWSGALEASIHTARTAFRFCRYFRTGGRWWIPPDSSPFWGE